MYGREARIPADLVYGPPSDELSEPRDTPEFVEQQSTALQQAYEYGISGPPAVPPSSRRTAAIDVPESLSTCVRRRSASRLRTP